MEQEVVQATDGTDEVEESDLRVSMVPKKAQSTHLKLVKNVKMNKTTKSAHMLSDTQNGKDDMVTDYIILLTLETLVL